MKIANFKPFKGQHCETTATGSLLKQIGIELSEPMLFGIGEGLGYIFWNMKLMDFPFIGGRIKTDKLTENICRNLHLKLESKETSSLRKAWQNIKVPLANGKAVGLKLDCYHLDYFTNKIHFAGHYVTIYGYDDTHAYLNDTDQQGGLARTMLRNLELARNEKGPMSSRNLSFTIEQTTKLPDLEPVIKKAIYNNATDFLNPPIKNLGHKGMEKTASEIKKWFKESDDVQGEFQTTAMLMERAGTGGALFRNLYRDFLKEAYELTGMKELNSGYLEFREHAMQWNKISTLFLKIGETKDEKYLNKASETFIELAKNEKQTMEKLRYACA
ncbi:BtrH N-terminal domain-containing protein [Flavobacteriaceae bacterium GF1]